MSFADLSLSPLALKAVDDLGYEDPTPVQKQAIPLVIEGRDIVAAAKTGTGKTAAFSLPAMDRLGHGSKGEGPLMLVVTPTRELAQQIFEVAEVVGRHTHHRVGCVVGGVSLEPQIAAIRKGVDVLVATPGRLIDLMNQRAVSLSSVRVLVLDEADRMLDMGFWPSVKRIVDATPANRQTLLFSATIDKAIAKTADSILDEPAVVEIAKRGETADTIDQYLIRTPQDVKPALIKALLAEKGAERVIVFARTRSRADSTCRRLKRAGFSAEAIHSDRSQNQRRRALDNFAQGKTDIIVATDVLARGIDVDGVSYVVNYDLPSQPEDYVHRIGRTGRAGHEGFSVSFVTPESEDDLKAIERLTRKPLKPLALNSFDMAGAIEEAKAKAQRAQDRKDPEIQQAKRELASREQKKQAARERSKQEATGNRSSAKRKEPKTASSPKRDCAPRRSGSGAAKGSAGRNPKPDAAKSRATARGNADLKPGRAHRADLARRRSRS